MDRHLDLKRAVMAISATIFACVGLAGLMAFGDAQVRVLAIAAALLGCFGQFAGQDASRPALIAHLVASYGAFALALWAIVALVLF